MIREIVEVVAQHFGVSSHALLNRDRRSRFVEPRRIAMYLCRMAMFTFHEIGTQFGMHHSTVMHHVEFVTENLRNVPADLIDKAAKLVNSPAPPQECRIEELVDLIKEISRMRRELDNLSKHVYTKLDAVRQKQECETEAEVTAA